MNPHHDMLALADRCVKCGLCLPRCPTYRLDQNENASPRGRIALIQALARQEISPDDPRLRQHLDQCLLCRRCEQMCPSGVEYSRLMDLARQQLPPPAPRRRLGLRLLSRHMQGLCRLLYLFQQSGLERVLRPLLRTSRLYALKPRLSRPRSFRPHYPPPDSAPAPERGRVAIFTGCTGRNLDAAALAGTIELLSALGYRVELPARQTCCGGLQQHSGLADEARQLARQNLQAFVDEEYEAVLWLASGCGAQLAEYPQQAGLAPDELAHARRMQAKLRDVSGFLLTALRQHPLPFAPLEKRVAVHRPCSQHGLSGQPDSVAPLLALIPGIRLVELPDDTPCCGAAGDYLLRHPDTARALRQPLLERLLAENVDIVVSSNPGCGLFLQAGLKEQGIRVMHPAELLNRMQDKTD